MNLLLFFVAIFAITNYCHGQCPLSWRGDGSCDDGCNTKAFNYDGGDCCNSTSPSRTVVKTYCNFCACKQLANIPGQANPSSQRYCDKENFFEDVRGFQLPPLVVLGPTPTPRSDFKRDVQPTFGSSKKAVPWQVSVRLGKEGDGHKCGGSILDERTIVTAASCFEPYVGMQLTGFYVKAGSPYRYTHNSDTAGDTKAVDKFIWNTEMPYFDYRGRQNDIVLLKLKDALTFSSKVKPVCLPEEDTYEPLNVQDAAAIPTLGGIAGATKPVTKCYTSGWGIKANSPFAATATATTPTTFTLKPQHISDNEEASKNSYSLHVQWFGVSIIRKDICQADSQWRPVSTNPLATNPAGGGGPFGDAIVRITKSMMCGSGNSFGSQFCDGDMGNPLVCELNEGAPSQAGAPLVLAGIASFGIGYRAANSFTAEATYASVPFKSRLTKATSRCDSLDGRVTGDSFRPGRNQVYTNIAPFLPWIRSNMESINSVFPPQAPKIPLRWYSDFATDAICDDITNTEEYNWDADQCCINQGTAYGNFPDHEPNYKMCSHCTCVQPKSTVTLESCGNPKAINNGECDLDNNNELCDYDGGDCCPSDRHDLLGTPHAYTWFSDDDCDDHDVSHDGKCGCRDINLCSLGGATPATTGAWNDQLFTYNAATGGLTTRSGNPLVLVTGVPPATVTHRSWSLRTATNFGDITSESTTCIIQSAADNRVLSFAAAAPAAPALATFTAATLAGTGVWTKGPNILMKPIVTPVTPPILLGAPPVLAANQNAYFTLADATGAFLAVPSGPGGPGTLPTGAITRTPRNTCTPAQQALGPTAVTCSIGAVGAGPDWQRACPAPTEEAFWLL